MRAAHLQCPKHHDHPQPFEANGRRYCAACYHRDGTLTEMTVCDGSDPERCEFGEKHDA